MKFGLNAIHVLEDLDPLAPVQTLRAQLEADFEVLRFDEVKIVLQAQEAKVQPDGDDLILEVQCASGPESGKRECSP